MKRAPLLATALALAAILAANVWIKADVVAGLDPALSPWYTDAAGDPFLYTQDSYYYLRQSAEIVDHGFPGSRRVEGRPWDDLSYAPEGQPAQGGLLARLQAWAWRAWPGDASLVRVAAYLPPVATSLLVLLVFALGLRLGGPPCGVIAALLAATHPEIVSHCHAGIADTTYLNLVLMTAVAAGALALATAVGRGAWRRAALAAAGLAALAALFAWTWTAWLAAVAPAAAFLGVLGIVAALRSPAPAGRRRLVAAALGLLLAVGAVALVLSPVFERILDYVGVEPGILGTAPFFPRATLEIDELAPLGPGELVESLGGIFLAGLAALGVPLALRRGRTLDAALLLAYLLPAAAAGMLAMRFAVYAAPAAVVLAAYAIVRLAEGPSRNRLARTAIAAAAALAVVWTFADRLEAFERRRPAVDRALAEAASTLAERAAPDALVDVWWDRGYAWAALGGRGVVVDGGSNQRDRVFWYSKALAARNENLAVNLLRVIDCGRDAELFDLLRRAVGPEPAVAALDRALRRASRPAIRRRLLEDGVPTIPARRAARLIAECRPPEAWIVVSSDLAAKTTSWVDFARWDFAGPRPRIGPRVTEEVECRFVLQRLSCDNGIYATLEEAGLARIPTPDGRLAARGRPDEEGLVPILYDRGDGLRLVYLVEGISDSLFVELYYFRGGALDRFELVDERHYPPFTERVLLFRLDWG